MGMIETKTANAIRVLSADAIQKAKSGHPWTSFRMCFRSL